MTDGKQTGDSNIVKVVADDLRSKGFTIFAISTSAYSKMDVSYSYFTAWGLVGGGGGGGGRDSTFSL